MSKHEGRVRLNFNNPVFQEHLLTLQKAERHAALDTLNKIRQLTWNHVYRDPGLKWEKLQALGRLKVSTHSIQYASVRLAAPQRTVTASLCVF